MAMVSFADTDDAWPPGHAPPQLLFVGHSTNRVAGALKSMGPVVDRTIVTGLALPRTIVFMQELEADARQMLALPKPAATGRGPEKIAARVKARGDRNPSASRMRLNRALLPWTGNTGGEFFIDFPRVVIFSHTSPQESSRLTGKIGRRAADNIGNFSCLDAWLC